MGDVLVFPPAIMELWTDGTNLDPVVKAKLTEVAKIIMKDTTPLPTPTRLTDLTLEMLVVSAEQGIAHPTDVIRLVEEVRWYKENATLLYREFYDDDPQPIVVNTTVD